MKKEWLVDALKWIVTDKKILVRTSIFIAYFCLGLAMVSDQGKIQLLETFKKIPLIGILVNGSTFELFFYIAYMVLILIVSCNLVILYFLPNTNDNPIDRAIAFKQKKFVSYYSMSFTTIFVLGLSMSTIIMLYFQMKDLFSLNYWLINSPWSISLLMLSNLIIFLLGVWKKKFKFPAI